MSLSYPNIITELPGPKGKVIIAKDEQYLSPSYMRSYPLVVAKGSGLMIEDVDGNRFLDMTAGIAVTATGHCNPKIVDAIKGQAEPFLHMCGADFYYQVQSDLAERLASLMPGSDPKRVFFCNSGTEAVEAAIKLARYHTGRTHLIGFYGSFHGRTCGSLSITASKPVQKHGFLPLLPGVHHAPYPDPRRCPSGTSEEKFASQCIEWICKQMFQMTLPPNEVAAIIVEPIQGEGGYIVPPANFLKELEALCRKHGILLVVDEVQTAIGRTGRFLASEHIGVEPDIITLGKGIASGLPLGVMISRAELMDWPSGAHASTFGGNPVACVAALETIKLVEQELMANAAKQGDYLKQKLLSLQEKYPCISDVRGIGLMLAIEIGKEKERDKSIVLRNTIITRSFQKGLLLLGCGAKAIRFCPALSISKVEIDVAMTILDQVLSETAAASGDA